MPPVLCDLSTPLDGSVTGPDDSTEGPFGDGAEGLHDWLSDAATPEDHAVPQPVSTHQDPTVSDRRVPCVR